jgi:Protein of unknown function (DUF3433)
MIEPLWHVLNRHLCVLVPFDGLRRGRQTAKDTINANYNSLPPQLVFWKALVRKHYLLAAVCFMTLLAHLFSVAASGLFFENTVETANQILLTQPYSPKFKSLNGSAQTFLPSNHALLEPYYILTSNATADTPMPPWTDHEWFYLPFAPPSDQVNATWNYRATTFALRGNLTCSIANYTFSFVDVTLDEGSGVASRAAIQIFHTLNNRTVTCLPRYKTGPSPDYTFFDGSSGLNGFEFSTPLDAVANSSFEDGQFCREQIIYGWGRANLWKDNAITANCPDCWNVTDYEMTVIGCQAQIERASADIMVDYAGHVLERYSLDNITGDVQSLFNTTPSDLLGQINQFMSDKFYSNEALCWHNDSFPSDFNQYLLAMAMNTTEFLNPLLPPPDAQDMIDPVVSQYSSLFSVAIGRNMMYLLENDTSGTEMKGDIIRAEVRIFMSHGLFIIAEAILGLYIIVAIVLYSRRPWRVLVRPPTTLASILAYFAASHALEDIKDDSPQNLMESPGRKSSPQEMERIYGFGTFVGTDGKVHIGVEKHPYLAGLKKTNTTLTWRSGSSEKGIRGKEWWKKIELQSSKVKEGGWL